MIQTQKFGQFQGREVVKYTLVNDNGMQVALLSYGAITQSIFVNDNQGHSHPMILGFQSLDDYVADDHYIGAMVGRYANRIAHGRYQRNGETVQLEVNAEPHQLHGGPQGLHNRVWDSQPFTHQDSLGVEFTTVLQDGLSGFPGDVKITARYELSHNNRLTLVTTARTNKETPINLTHHGYFTLGRRDVITPLQLQINAQHITPSDATLIPTGDLEPVAGTPFDFRRSKTIGEHLLEPHPQLEQGQGYDHNYQLDSECADLTLAAAELYNPELGISMSLFTSKPGLQLYSGNFIHHSAIPDVPQNGAVCLEPQYFPDSVNQPHFPSCWLTPDEVYSHTTSWLFLLR